MLLSVSITAKELPHVRKSLWTRTNADLRGFFFLYPRSSALACTEQGQSVRVPLNLVAAGGPAMYSNIYYSMYLRQSGTD